MIIALCGKSGSGKTRICEEMMALGWAKIITYTTRPRRPHELNHYDYEFVDDLTFTRMQINEEFVEMKTYFTGQGMWCYGSRKDDYMKSGNLVIVLTPSGIRSVQRQLPNEDIRVVMIDSDKLVRMYRLWKRGDNKAEIVRRMRADEYDFEDFEPDYSFRNAMFTDPKKLAERIIKEVSDQKQEAR